MPTVPGGYGGCGDTHVGDGDPKGGGREEGMTLLPAPAPLPRPRTPFLPKTHPMTPKVGGLPIMHAPPCATLVGKGHREAEAQ